MSRATRGPSARSTVRRLPQRARYDRDSIDRILDEGAVCHVGFVSDGKPFVIPTGYARVGDAIMLHGSKSSRMLQLLADGCEACVTVTLLDGMVLARSALHHSMNYRSVVAFGRARRVTSEDEKRVLFDALVEHLVPGRTRDARRPSPEEMRATEVVLVPLDECSAKVRTGPPIDSEEDKELDVWAGVVPLQLTAQAPVPDEELRPNIALPHYAEHYSRPGTKGAVQDE